MPVEKAIILTAGLGTRFLPMTKAVPKAMLPIIDKPVVQYLVEEAVASGIKEIIIVMGRGAQAIERHFNHSDRLENELKARGKEEFLKKVEGIEKAANYVYVYQDEARGDGHALLCAKRLVRNEPFAVLFGDDIIDGPQPALKQLLEVYKETGSSVICTERVAKENISSYGVVGPGKVDGRKIKVNSLVEKPNAEDAPSEFGIIGKYICTPEVMDYLEKAEAGHTDGEIRLIDGFRRMLEDGKPIHALEVDGSRFDTGNRLGLMMASLHYGLKDPEIKGSLIELLKDKEL